MNDLALYNLRVAFPTCAICNKPVDKVETMYHPAYQGKLFRVHCHGQYEDQMLDDTMFCGSDQVTFGKAFQKPQIEVTKENK